MLTSLLCSLRCMNSKNASWTDLVDELVDVRLLQLGLSDIRLLLVHPLSDDLVVADHDPRRQVLEDVSAEK